MTSASPGRLSHFADLAQHYSDMVASPPYVRAFGEEIATAQLSVYDEPCDDALPDAREAQLCVEQITAHVFDLFAATRLESFAARIAWGVVNSFHRVASQVEAQEEAVAQKLGELARSYDPSEIYQVEIEETQRVCQSLAEARAALECMRDHAADIYRVETGSAWSSTSGSRVSSKYSASQIEARDFLASRAKARREQFAPSGPIVIISGSHIWEDHSPVYARLDLIKRRVPSMTLATTAQTKGVDAIATAWAAHNAVPVVAFRLNRALGNAAPFKRNKLLVSLAPVEAIVCQGSGIQINLADECRKAGIPLTIIRKSDCSRNKLTERKAA